MTIVYRVINGIALAILAGFMGYYATMFILEHAPQENEKRVHSVVKKVCDYSRERTSGEAEEACGIAQDDTLTRYVCPSYKAPTSQCIVEDAR